jgi:recombination protein RecA
MSDRSSAALRAFLESARGKSATDGARIISLGERRAVVPAARWELDEIVGRLTELSGIGAVASLTAATALVLEAQGRGEPSAWLSLPSGSFYPPDLDDAGVDLDALVVVRAPDVTVMARAADRLLRSAAFGLVVLDLGAPSAPVSMGPAGPPLGGRVGVPAEIPIAVQGRLVGLAQHHDAAIVVLTEKPRESASLGSMVSLRAEAMRERASGGRSWRIAVRAVKDKRRGPGWSELADVVGPAGLP